MPADLNDYFKKKIPTGGGSSNKGGGGSGFVELDAPGVVAPAQGGVLEVEVCDGSREGQRMAIRLQGCSEVDVVSMVNSFWRRGR